MIHLYFVSDSNEQETTFCTVDSDLSNQFIEGLSENGKSMLNYVIDGVITRSAVHENN